MSKRDKPILGITMGDPQGIGAEIILKALPDFRKQAEFKVFGDAVLLSGLEGQELQSLTEFASVKGLTARDAGAAAVGYLEAAMAAFERGEIEGLVTAPISKDHVAEAGFSFPGHTEYLAHKTGVKDFLMMMAGPRLKVTLVTIHEPLSSVSSKLNLNNIAKVIEITYQSLKTLFGIPRPRVAVCGLNPHGGEQGRMGREEIEIIAPAIAQAAQKGYPSEGPKVPDAVFHEAYEGGWDAVVCMYHDQGLIPFKMIHFADGVNVTLGLPLVRTSPDHGTAFDIAGKGVADPSSMKAAISLALELMARSHD
jgi:4-hydroxythreonine-4-phosphate dehydrogenase